MSQRLFPPTPYVPTETIDVEAPDGSRYRLFVAPAMSAPGPAGRPLLLVLDGYFYTPVLSTVCRSRGFINAEIDEPHIVGIGYPSDDLEDWLLRRNRDLTPTVPAQEIEPGQDLSPHLWGGGDALLDLIESVILPRVCERWAVNRSKMALLGHSYGGLATLHAMFTRPQLFASWIAISPSVWWEDGRVLQAEAESFLRALRGSGLAPRLFMATGELEEKVPVHLPTWSYATPEHLAAHKAYTRMLSRMLALGEHLRAGAAGTGLVVQTRGLPGETHASTVFAALTPALDMAFAPAR